MMISGDGRASENGYILAQHGNSMEPFYKEPYQDERVYYHSMGWFELCFHHCKPNDYKVVPPQQVYLSMAIYDLVGGISTPLKNMKSVAITIPNIYGKIKNVPNHEPVMYYNPK